MNAESEIRTIKLVDDMISEQENQFNPEDNLNYTTEYKITPSINEKIYKLDPMIVIGICLLIALIIFIGYKLSPGKNNVNIVYN